MKITPIEITVSDIFAGFKDNQEAGVVAYGGKLNVRPPYQREFIYDNVKQEAVIHTICKGFPLNVMYWAKNPDGTYELLDGQQRTLSFCKFIDGGFSVDMTGNGDIRYFHNLLPDEQKGILDYKLTIYVCEGSESEKLEWFKIINIAGEKLTPQELRNAVYTGPWLADAKLFFSKTNCVAYKLGEPYMKGAPIRQDYLEEVLSWCAASDEISIEEYMAQHQHDQNASGLKEYFKDVIGWAKQTFPNYRKEMKGLPWGIFYNKYRQLKVDPKELEKKISALMMDDDVTKKSGVYEYVLTDDERTLNIRAFSAGQKRAAYERQQGICPFCKAEGIDKKWELSEMDADHIIPWSQGGHTVTENCQMLCKPHNRRKSAK